MSKKNIKAYFEIKNNELFYYPPNETVRKVSHNLKVTGKWRLDKNYNFVFDVNESYNNIFGQSIIFCAKIEHATKDYIEVSFLERTTPKLHNVSSTKFKGRWRLDSKNNLIFEIRRSSGFDELIFGDKWQITKENNIVLFYKRKFAKKEILDSLILEGRFAIDKNALIYSIENSSNSKLKFALALNTKVKISDTKLDLTVGARKNSLKTITLFGKCRNLNDALEFDMNLGGKKQAWVFKLSKQLSSGKSLLFELINTEGEPIGVQVTFSKKSSSGGNFFIRAKVGEEKRIEDGVYIPF